MTSKMSTKTVTDDGRCPECHSASVRREPHATHGATRDAMAGMVCELCGWTGGSNSGCSDDDVETTDPEERLELLLDELLVKPQENPDLSIALLEMRSQAPYKAVFSKRFQQNDEYIRYLLKAVINQRIDEGTFNDVSGVSHDRDLLFEDDIIEFETDGQRKIPCLKHEVVVAEPIA